MTQPSPQQIGAAIAALRAEADIWDDIHERLNRCASFVRTLQITEYADVTFFAPFLTPYHDVVEWFADRCAEGAVQTFSVGLALVTVANGFAAAEETNLRRLHSLVESEDSRGLPSR